MGSKANSRCKVRESKGMELLHEVGIPWELRENLLKTQEGSKHGKTNEKNRHLHLNLMSFI